jgi:anti-sigma B factor antagonist
MNPKGIEIQTRQTPDMALVIPVGEVDMSSSTQLRDILMGILRQKKETVIVSLEEVDYIDSSGLATLIEGFQKTVHYGGTFKLIINKPKIMDVFKLARLNRIFDIFESREAAGVKIV